MMDDLHHTAMWLRKPVLICLWKKKKKQREGLWVQVREENREYKNIYFHQNLCHPGKMFSAWAYQSHDFTRQQQIKRLLTPSWGGRKRFEQKEGLV